MSVSARFGAIRELVQQPPSEQGWSELCARVEEAVEALGAAPVVEVILPYVVDNLRARWPAALCVAPLRWLTEALASRPSPCLPMARALLISRSSLSMMAASAGLSITPAAWWERMLSPRDAEDAADAQRLTELLGHISALEALAGVAHVTLDCLRLDDASTEQLNLWSTWARVEGLTVRGGSVPLHELLCNEHLRLRRLRVEHAALSVASVQALIAHHKGLESLVVHRSKLSPNVLRPIWAGEQGSGLPALAELELFACTHTRSALDGFDTPGAFPALRRLELAEGSLTQANVQTLTTFEGLSALERLGLAGAGLNIKQLNGLLDALGDCALRELDLSGSTIGPEGATTLAAREGLAHLERLDLHECALGNKGIKALGDGQHLKGLQVLGLRDNNLSGPQAMSGFAEAFPALRELDLGGKNKLRTAGVTLLAEHPGLSRLGLGRNSIKPEGAQALAQAPGSARLKALDLSGNRLGVEGVHALIQSPHLSDLRELILGTWMVRNDLGDDGALLLSAWPALRTLEILSIYNDTLGPEGAAALAASPHMRNLRVLDLSQNRIGDTGLAALAASPLLSTVRILLLELCGITSVGLQALASSPHARRLEIVSLRGNHLWPVSDLHATLAGPALPNLQMIDLGDDALYETTSPIHNIVPCGWLDGRRIRRWPMRDQSWWHELFMG